MTPKPEKLARSTTDEGLLLRTVPLFAELTNADIDWFLKQALPIEYLKNNFLFQCADSADFLYLITEGWIKIYHDNQEGEQIVQAILTRGDTFGEECVVKGRTHSSSAQVIGRNAKCLLISGETLRERLSDHPNVALKIISSLADQLNKTSYFWELNSKLTTAQRLAAFLLKLSMDRDGTQKILLPYNKLLVAARLGTQPETLSRAMKRLNDDLNVSFKGREVFIPDLSTLQDYCKIYCCRDTECSITQKLLCTDVQCDVSRMLKMM